MKKPQFTASELPSPAWTKLFDVAVLEAVLQAAAREGRALSYSEMLGRLGYHFSRPKMRILCAALGEVDARAARRGEPELAILVVRASDGIPGAGWWSVADTRDYHGTWEGPEALAYIQKRQARVFGVWGSKRQETRGKTARKKR